MNTHGMLLKNVNKNTTEGKKKKTPLYRLDTGKIGSIYYCIIYLTILACENRSYHT